MYVVGAVDVLFMFLKEGNAVSPEEAKEAAMERITAGRRGFFMRCAVVAFPHSSIAAERGGIKVRWVESVKYVGT